MSVRHPEDELAELQHRRTPQFAAYLNRLAHALVRAEGVQTAENALARLIAETMGLADMYGRRRLVLETKGDTAMWAGRGASLGATPLVPDVPFEEAIRDIVAREPVLAASALEVSQIYSERHAFALARSASQNLTERIQGYMAKALREGRTVDEARKDILGISKPYRASGGALSSFTAAYSETVYRTNLATAYSAGRLRMVRDPDVKDLAPAWEFRAVLDSGSRPNHRAAHGLVAAVDDPVWEAFTPPLGYNCRCSLRMVGPDELRRRGLAGPGGAVSQDRPAGFSAAHPDERFGRGRPDRRIYG